MGTFYMPHMHYPGLKGYINGQSTEKKSALQSHESG